MRRPPSVACRALVAVSAMILMLGCSGAGGHRDRPARTDAGPGAGPIAARPVDSTTRVTMRRAEFAVAGMTCGACAAATRITLERLDGVDEAGASYEDGQAWARYDPTRVTPEDMERAIRTLGYRPTQVTAQQTR